MLSLSAFIVILEQLLQVCAWDELSGGYLPAKVVQNCSKCSITGLNYSVKPAWVVVKSGWVVVGPTTTNQCGHIPVIVSLLTVRRVLDELVGEPMYYWNEWIATFIMIEQFVEQKDSFKHSNLLD